MAERGVRSRLQQVQLPYWEYLGGESLTLDGATSQAGAIPSTASIIELRAESGEVYFDINAVDASAASPGYVPEDAAEIIGPLANLTSFRVFSATANAVAHIMYFREN